MGEFVLNATSIPLNQMGQDLSFSLEAKWYHTAHSCTALLSIPRKDGLSLAEGFLGWLGGMNRRRCQRHVQALFCCCHEGIQDSVQHFGKRKAIFCVIHFKLDSRPTFPWSQSKGTDVFRMMHCMKPISAFNWISCLEQSHEFNSLCL